MTNESRVPVSGLCQGYCPSSMHAPSLTTSGYDTMLLHHVSKKLEADAVTCSMFAGVSDSAYMV